MPYVILTANGDEIERREVDQAVTVGRSAECDVSVRDILLSRRHCRLEPITAGKEKGRWRLVDLESRNGCHVNWKKVTEYTLVDGDTVRIGRTWLTFHTGPFVPAPADATPKRKTKLVRPADPHEALAGTVADFIFVERDANGEEFDATPSPTAPGKSSKKKAAATNPAADVGSSWDSIVATATAAKPRRTMARPMPRDAEGRLVNAAGEPDLSLQAMPAQIPFLEVVPALPKRKRNWLPAAILTVGVTLATAVVLVSTWILTKG